MGQRPVLNALKASDALFELPYHRDGRYSLGESKYRGLYSACHVFKKISYCYWTKRLSEVKRDSRTPTMSITT